MKTCQSHHLLQELFLSKMFQPVQLGEMGMGACLRLLWINKD